MGTAFDERCAADLSNVVDGRGLGREDSAWLARAVTGAVRPNRDKPLWDLARCLAALGQGATSGRDLVDLALDPRLARGPALRTRLEAGGSASDERGLALPPNDAGRHATWHATWAGAGRLLALAEFWLTAEDLASFAEILGWLDELVRSGSDPAAVDLLTRRLVRLSSAYRAAHLPLAPVEKRFRAILTFLAGRASRGRGFDEDDILDYWRAEIRDGERVSFRTVAEHFITYEGVASVLGGLAGVTGATSLDAVEGWEDRLDATLGDVVGTDAAAPLASAMDAFADGPKVLTGAEREDLADIVRLEPFHRTRPLTVLRAISFGRVQSGIANRLRRGSGGAEIAARVRCEDAEPYEAIDARARDLAAYLARMIRIAAALRIGSRDGDGRVADALKAAEADIRRVRRAGFDDREALARAFADLDDVLLRAGEEIAAFTQAVTALSARRPLAAAFGADRPVFADALTHAYAEALAP